jgi:hypothetical protein
MPLRTAYTRLRYPILRSAFLRIVRSRAVATMTQPCSVRIARLRDSTGIMVPSIRRYSPSIDFAATVLSAMSAS